MNRRPSQLKKIRKAHYEKLYARQPQLIEKLIPFLNRAETIAEHQEQFGIRPFNVQKIRKEKEKLIRKLNKLSANKPTKTKQKMSEVPPEILWSLR